MSLDFNRMAADLYARGTAIRFRGPRFMDYCTVVSQGSVMSVTSKSFLTVDAGLVPAAGAGAGIGTGLTAITVDDVKGKILTTAHGLRFRGPRLEDKARIFAEALVQELTHLTFTSVHHPVYLGTGIVTPGSIPVEEPEWAGNIFTQGTAKRFRGPRWMDWCTCLATGSVFGFTTATGQVVITGSFGGSIPPGPVPGAGAGTGIVS